MVSFANDVNGNAPLYYLSATMGSNAGTGFQQMITLNSSNYSTYEGTALLNINVQDGAGNIVDSWLESGFTSSSSASIYWVKMPATITELYFVFYGTSKTSKDNSVTGCAPTYDGTYGHYDNGANVFTFYDNFAGSTLNASWTTIQGTISVNNMLSMGLDSPTAYNTATLGVGYCLDTFVINASNPSGNGAESFGIYETCSTYPRSTISIFGYTNGTVFWNKSSSGEIQGSNLNSTYSYTNTILTINFEATTASAQINYGTRLTTSGSTDYPAGTANVAFTSNGSPNSDTTVQWMKGRMYAVMPSVTLGSVTQIVGYVSNLMY